MPQLVQARGGAQARGPGAHDQHPDLRQGAEGEQKSCGVAFPRPCRACRPMRGCWGTPAPSPRRCSPWLRGRPAWAAALGGGKEGGGSSGGADQVTVGDPAESLM